MTFRTLMQAGPARANELFAKLAGTSAGAVKTREKLFSELKAELELHTSLEEQHLLSCTRFLWTPICPRGDRNDEVQHERNRSS